jgi:hypothetical protein
MLPRPRRVSGRRWVVAGLLAGLTALTAWQLPAEAYEADTHYGWTYYLALHLGCSRRQAYQVASAAFAIDMDPNTSPMAAKAGETIRGTPNPRIKGIWLKFHAFADHERPVAEHEPFKRDQKNKLRALAARERNPGPLVHYNQDYFSHGGYDTRRGHALAGHQPDFLSRDPAKSRRTTDSTLSVIGEFMRSVLGQEPAGVDGPRLQRIHQVLDELIRVNPYPSRINPTNYDWTCRSGVPIVPRAINALNDAIGADQKAGLLPRCLDNHSDRQELQSRMDFAAGVEDRLPMKWIEFEYDGEGRVVDRDRKLKQFYGVEKARVEIIKHEIRVKPVDARNSEITLRMHYRLAGLRANLPFVNPLPVVEMHKLSDFPEPRVFNQTRGNGDFVSEFKIQRPNADFENGDLKWKCTIYAHDLKPLEREVKVEGGGLQRSVLFLVDTSGSMGGAKIMEARKAVADLIAKSAAEAPGEEEWAILGFSNHNVFEIQPFTQDAEAARAAANTLAANGDTPLRYGQAKATVYLLKNAKATEGRLIILCDGDDNCPGPTCKGRGITDRAASGAARDRLLTTYKKLQLRPGTGGGQQ